MSKMSLKFTLHTPLLLTFLQPLFTNKSFVCTVTSPTVKSQSVSNSILVHQFHCSTSTVAEAAEWAVNQIFSWWSLSVLSTCRQVKTSLQVEKYKNIKQCGQWNPINFTLWRLGSQWILSNINLSLLRGTFQILLAENLYKHDHIILVLRCPKFPS